VSSIMKAEVGDLRAEMGDLRAEVGDLKGLNPNLCHNPNQFCKSKSRSKSR
jgi:hypothetical protein